ncbi:uracil-DNA glycosylase [uncultured Amnibacterium sp.]|uniref:uracil-DNA glycosylase n=1 Tax=uncultured Amnibacterium sp. TaxID=1631851 RepID=UPI0035CB532D
MLSRFLELLAGLRADTPPDAEFLYDAATEAGALRLGNLSRYLELTAGATTLLVGEAPGWRGATITGVPFMSVRELTARPGILTGRAEGDGFVAPPDPAAGWELSASIVQKALRGWPVPPVSWPVYPNHPFVAGDRATNRPPRVPEVRAGAPIALELVRALGIRRVVAIGRKAEHALAAAGIEATAVRHPAQGGAALFAAGMAALGREAA